MQLLNQAALFAQGVSRLFTATETACTLPKPFDSVTGTCISVDTCSAFATPGFCVGPATIQCCTDTFAPSSDASTGILSDLGLSLIESFEGYRENFYCDLTHNPPAGGGRHCESSEGKLTIGWGHLCKPESACDWIQTPFKQDPDGDTLFRQDLQAKVDCVNNQVTAALTQNQFDALIDFAYNAGCGSLGRVATFLNAGDFAGATSKMKEWTNHGDRLAIRRRAIEVNMFNS